MSFPFADHGSYPVRSAPPPSWFVDGEAAFAAISDAIEGARQSVHVTIAYGNLGFRFRPDAPDQSLLAVLSRAAQRRVQVAVLSWLPETGLVGDTLPRSDAAALGAAGILSRWDAAKAPGLYQEFHAGCHHQKTFVIDGTVAFVGGINVTQMHWDSSSHLPWDERRVSFDVTDPEKRRLAAHSPSLLPWHDTFARVVGAPAYDVQANFLERWNGASERMDAPDLPVPPPPPPDPGDDLVPLQIVRTLPSGEYPHTAAGELGVKEAMLNLLSAARTGVYFENQYFFDAEVTAAIRRAAQRGVRVVGLLCRRPDAGSVIGTAEKFLIDKEASAFQWTRFDEAISRRVQLYSPYTDRDALRDVYVHSKTMVVDDRWVLLGSANISFMSLEFHSEMCVLSEDRPSAAALRRQLWCEHLCLADGQLPITFEAGANLWQLHGQRNAKDVADGHPPRSRIAPFVPPSVEDLPTLRAASGLDVPAR